MNLNEKSYIKQRVWLITTVSPLLLLLFSCNKHAPSSPSIGPPAVPFQTLRVEREVLLNKKEIEAKIADCEKIFYKGLASQDETELMATLQAIAYTHHPLAKGAFAKCLQNDSVAVQLATLHALSLLNTNYSAALIREALQSPYILIRLQAIWLLLETNQPLLFPQIFSLQKKVPPLFFPFFAELYAKEGSYESLHQLQKMAYEESDEVASAVFLAIYNYRLLSCREFVLSFRSHSNIVLESLSKAIGLFSTTNALQTLQTLSQHENIFIRTEAIASRVRLGEIEAKEKAVEEYFSGNRYILPACESIEKELNFASLQKNEIEISELLYFLKREDRRAIELLKSLIRPNTVTEGIPFFQKKSSPGKAISWWEQEKGSLYRSPASEDSFIVQEQSQRFLEKALLLAAANLPQKELFSLLEMIAYTKRVDLYPVFFSLLEQISEEQSEKIVTQFQHSLGSPYLRAYIALWKMKKSAIFDPEIAKSCFETARSEKESIEKYRFPLPYMASYRDERTYCDTTSHLYMMTCQISLELAQDEVVDILYKELEKSPSHLRPYIAAAIVECAN